MNILFENETDYNFSGEEMDIFNNVIEETLRYENFPANAEISITIVTNAEIQKINSKFRNIDKPTDVLSFPLLDFENTSPLEPSETIILGDIVISIEKALSQSEEYGHSIERELGFLTAHSMLHLLGYDHINPDEEKIMFSKQEEILNNIKLRR